MYLTILTCVYGLLKKYFRRFTKYYFQRWKIR